LPELEPRARMAHLLRRAGFGPAPGEIDQRLAEGYEATVQQLVESGAVAEGLGALDQQIGGLLDFGDIGDVRTWWVYRMIHSRRPLVEKMAFFWHGHFATAVSKVGSPWFMYLQNQLFRERGLGQFEDLLLRASRDPAMLAYLDGSANKKAHPNENYAREVMELFTFGLGHYDEKDVQEAARAFTGWQLRDDAFFFNAAEHDDGPKTFLGQTGTFDGSDIVRILAQHPATAERLVRKLWTFFAYEDPEPKVLAPLLARWKETRGNLREVVRALFLSPAFSSEQAFRARIKSPAEFVIGAVRALGGTIAPRAVVGLMARMGQDLFNPPSVKGWDGGMAWISTSNLFERFNFAASITTARGPEGTSHLSPEAICGGLLPTSSQQLLEMALAHLLDGRASAASRAALLGYLDTPDPQGPKDGKGQPLTLAADKRAFDEKARGLFHLVLSSPDYQLN
jgi:Protein of unknown function (DUF1800)